MNSETEFFESAPTIRRRPVLVVEEATSDFRGIAEILAKAQLEALHAGSAADALFLARVESPSLVLLNPELPELDGCRITKALRSHPYTESIPIVFLSSRRDVEIRRDAFEAGAADYIAKPFDTLEFTSRITQLIRLHELEAMRKANTRRLEDAVAAKTRQLSKAYEEVKNLNRRVGAIDRTKSKFLRTISHELRTPANGFFGAAELILDDCDPPPDPEVVKLLEESKDRLITLMDDAALLMQLRVEDEPVSVSNEQLHASLESIAAEYDINRPVNFDFADRSLAVRVNKDLFSIAVGKLLRIADCFAHDEGMRLSVRAPAETLVITIAIDGAVLPDHLADTFFDDFAVEESDVPHGSVGLQPSIVREATQGLDGAVRLFRENGAVVFELRLPRGTTSESASSPTAPAPTVAAGAS